VSSVFEGINAYWNPAHQQQYVFRLREHLQRLMDSARLAHLSVEYSVAELEAATVALLQRNAVKGDVHIRPWVFAAGNPIEQMVPKGVVCEVVVDSWPFESGLTTGRSATAAFTSWDRIGINVLPPRVKAFANYHNGRLGNIDARERGADWPIFLNGARHVTESSGACVGFFKDEVFHTPDLGSGILPSITRATILELLRHDWGISVVERPIERSEVYLADEVMFIGTSAEVLPIVRVDSFQIGTGAIGVLTSRLRADYLALVRGERPDRSGWLSRVWPGEDASARGPL
jgi:branched-chain amino acid aminotransferase